MSKSLYFCKAVGQNPSRSTYAHRLWDNVTELMETEQIFDEVLQGNRKLTIAGRTDTGEEVCISVDISFDCNADFDYFTSETIVHDGTFLFVMKFKVGSKVRVKNVYSGGNFDDGDIVTIKQIGNEDDPDCYGAISPYDGLMWYLNEDEVEAATCDFCSKWDWGEASADVDNGKFTHIYLAGGAFRFPVHKQFMYCPVCGAMNPNRTREKEVRDEL